MWMMSRALRAAALRPKRLAPGFRVIAPAIRSLSSLQHPASYPTTSHKSPLNTTKLLSRSFHTSLSHNDIPSWPNPPVPQPAATPYSAPGSPSSNGEDGDRNGNGKDGEYNRKKFMQDLGKSPIFQAGLTTIMGLIAVFAGGVGYLTWYKAHVLNKMEGAFAAGYDPALEIGKLRQHKHHMRHVHHKDEDGNDIVQEVDVVDGEEEEPVPTHIKRHEQALVDRIVKGEEVGSYWLMIGAKGTGKGTMIIDAMRSIQAEGAAFADAHGDLEVFRLRLGKALHYEYNEDWQGSLFSRRDPREGGPRLDIERAMNKLEKVALRYTQRKGRPLVLAFNNIHLFPNDEEGTALIHQLQQRAEAWAEAGICNMIFTTDDFWPLEAMKKNASRMRVMSVYDLPPLEAYNALRYLRSCYAPKYAQDPIDRARDRAQYSEVLNLLGGRTSFLLRVAKAGDMLQEAKDMVEAEKEWLLSRIGLIPDLDDDVMDEQKWSSCSWLLLQQFVEQQKESEEAADGDGIPEIFPPLPKMTFGKARVAMTRPDFLAGLDHANIIGIDNKYQVRPDSRLLYQAAKIVVEEEDFEERLTSVRDRVDEIEGLHRQSELTVKEPFKIHVDGGSIWSWFLPGRAKTIAVEGLGASFVPAKGDGDGDD